MGKLPEINPIDAGYIHRGGAVDHLGTTTIFCQACGSDQKAERFRMIMGRNFGFGAHIVVRPFLKRSSTRGKIGKRGTYALCCQCQSLWSQDQGARDSLENLGADPDGVVADHMAYEALNRSIEKEETTNPVDEPPKSRVRKLPPDTPLSETRPKAKTMQTSSRTCTQCGAITTIAQQRFCVECGTDLNETGDESKRPVTPPVAKPEKPPTPPPAAVESNSKTSQQRESNESTKQGDGSDVERTPGAKKDAETQPSADEIRARRTRNRAVKSDPEVRRLREELREAENRAREQRRKEELQKRREENRAREQREKEEQDKRREEIRAQEQRRKEEKIVQLEIQRDAKKSSVEKLNNELVQAEAHLAKIKTSSDNS